VVIACNLLFQSGFENDYKKVKPNPNLGKIYNFIVRTTAWLDILGILFQVSPLLILSNNIFFN